MLLAWVGLIDCGCGCSVVGADKKLDRWLRVGLWWCMDDIVGCSCGDMFVLCSSESSMASSKTSIANRRRVDVDMQISA